MTEILECGSSRMHTLNHGCYIKSLQLTDKQVALVGCPDGTEVLLRQHNTRVNVDGYAVQHIMVGDSLDRDSVLHFLRLRINNPDAKIFTLTDYCRKLSTNDKVEVGASQDCKFLSFLSFFDGNFDDEAKEKVVSAGGVFGEVNNIYLIDPSYPFPLKDYPMLNKFSSSFLLLVDQKWLDECIESSKLVDVDRFLTEALPSSPSWPNCKQAELAGCKFVVDPVENLKIGEVAYVDVILESIQKLGATVTLNEDEAIGRIAGPFGGASCTLVTKCAFSDGDCGGKRP